MSKGGKKRSHSKTSPPKASPPNNRRKTDTLEVVSPDYKMAECLPRQPYSLTDINAGSILDKVKQAIPDIDENSIKLVKCLSEALECEFSKSIEFLHESLTDVKQKLTEANGSIQSKDDENNRLTQRLNDMENKYKSLEYEQIQAKAYSMRNNLLLSGTTITRMKVGTSDRDLRCWFDSILWKLGCRHRVQVERIHWLGGSENIIVRFKNFQDRQDVWNTPRARIFRTVGSTFVNEHFPHPILEARKTLIPVCTEAIDQNLNAKVVSDKLYIDTKEYTIENLDSLPASLQPIRHGFKESEDSYVFFTKRSVLSNHAKTPFLYEGQWYSSGEQFWMKQKADFHKDEDAKAEILDTDDPVKQKAIGRRIKNVRMHVWKDQVRKLMFPGLLEKFKQNEVARNTLMNTGSKQIGEATTERYWGIGRKLSDDKVLNTKDWKDENIVGKMLVDLRSKLTTLGY